MIFFLPELSFATFSLVEKFGILVRLSDLGSITAQTSDLVIPYCDPS